MTWQPIATAPKDGTRVLLWDNCQLVAGFEHPLGYGPKDGCWVIVNDAWTDTPTHWKPLPAPPAK